MTHLEIRQAFLEFFRVRDHRVLPSASLIPEDDPTVLFTTAGMQPLKAYFLGQQDAQTDFGSRRVVSIQRCFRTTDIASVGDEYHNTFFEMLGNFSFGAYFKREAIEFAWTFLTETLRLDQRRLWVTVFAGDEVIPRDTEAEADWQRYVPKERISLHGRSENFWGPAGETGPCGPSTEIHIDHRGRACERGPDCRPNCPCGRFLELWNLVFTEWERVSDGSFRPLPTRNIDTGMGVERLALVLQSAPDVYTTDLFRNIVTSVRRLDGRVETTALEQTRRQRILADHLRAAVFLLADGVAFGNKDQGYVLRRLVRRALDHGQSLTLDLKPIVRAVIATYREVFPVLPAAEGTILDQLQSEQTAYARLQAVEVAEVLRKLRRSRPSTPAPVGPSSRQLTAEEAFHLYTTYGLSIGRLEREGFAFDRTAFESLVRRHTERSRQGAERKFGGHGLAHGVATEGLSADDIWKITRLHTATHLLHAALRQVLGSSVRQNGSDINPERLRFDFTFPRKLSDDEKRQIEDLVKAKIQADLPVRWGVLPYDQAIAQGALAFFREKYQPLVKVYTIGDFSKELCGGPHVEQTRQIGSFRLLSEKSIGAGLRRIKAVVEGAPLDRPSPGP